MKTREQGLFNQGIERVCTQTDSLYVFHNSIADAPTLTTAQVKALNRVIASLSVIITEARITT